MAGEKASQSFEATKAKVEVLLGLSGVKSADLMNTISDLEESGVEFAKRDPRYLGHVADWLTYTIDATVQMSEEGKVEPPLEPAVVADLQSKRTVYARLQRNQAAEAEAPAEEPSQPQRTSDAKS